MASLFGVWAARSQEGGEERVAGGEEHGERSPRVVEAAVQM